MPPVHYTLGNLTRKRADGSKYRAWCIKWTDGAGPHRVSLGTNDRASAEATARDFWSRRHAATLSSVGDVMTAYLASLPAAIARTDALAGRTAHTVTPTQAKDEKRKLESWKAAKAFWAGLRVPQISAETSRDYQRHRDRAANTIRNELGLIRTALHWAAEAGLIDKAPAIKLPSMPESEVPHLTKPQFRRFLAGCRAPHVSLFAQLAVTTGGRASALLELPWIRVDLDRRLLNLNPSGRIQRANKRRAAVPINDRLLPLLHEAREAALTPFVIETGGARIASIKTGFLAASRRSGVRCTPHMLRHSAAVWMAEERVPMPEIAAFLGHTNTKITERVYARFHPDYLRRAASALDW